MEIAIFVLCCALLVVAVTISVHFYDLITTVKILYKTEIENVKILFDIEEKIAVIEEHILKSSRTSLYEPAQGKGVSSSDRKAITEKVIDFLSKHAVKVDKETCPKLLQKLENLTDVCWLDGVEAPTEFDPFSVVDLFDLYIMYDHRPLNLGLYWDTEPYLTKVTYEDFLEMLDETARSVVLEGLKIP